MSKKGGYLGGHTVLNPGNGWFSAKDKGKRTEKRAKRLKRESKKHLRENPIAGTPIPGDRDRVQERLKAKRLKSND